MEKEDLVYIELKNGKKFIFTEVSEVHYDIEWKGIDVEFDGGGLAYINIEDNLMAIVIGNGIERNEY